MIHRQLFATAAVSALLLFGCNEDARDQQVEATEAQREADQKGSEAQKDANKKTAAAQAEADKTIAEAQAGFAKIVEDYRHKATTDLADLDKKVEALDAKALKETGAAKATLTTKLAEIRASREAFVADMKSLETGTAQTWDVAKARAEVKWTNLKTLVESS